MAEKTITKLPVKTEKAAVPERALRDWMPFENLRREVDRLFEDFHPFGWGLSTPLADLQTPLLSRPTWVVAPAMDLVEKDDNFEITAELPGLEDKDIEVKLSNHTLTIKGEKSEEKEDKRKDYYLSERRYGAFQRSIQLPDGIDADKIDASFSNGILTIAMPKTPEAKKAYKTIPVKAA